MKCSSFTAEMQNKLDDFFTTMYSERGLKYEPEGKHNDLRNIPSIYQIDGGGFWVIVNDEKIIGAAGLKILDRANGIGEVKRMAVLPECQGKGYGRLLLDNLIDEARRKSFCILRLDTMKSYEKALNLYRSSGFYEIEPYNDNSVAEVYMEKKL
jgi:ribosomal protein S18 acetylase RimI-like enzyme